MECRVELDYISDNPEDLTIRKDDKIIDVQPVKEGWYSGTLKLKHKKTGRFHENFVKLNVPSGSSDALEKLEFNVTLDRNAKTEDDLTIRKGDIIKNVEYLGNGWCKGTIKAQSGLFPKSHVEIHNASTTVPAFIVQHNFTATNDNELTIRNGELIRDMEKIGNGWCRGTVKEKAGLFPKNIVKINCAKISSDALKSIGFQVIADCIGESPSELTIHKGDILKNVEVGDKEGWLIGVLRGRRKGSFPEACVQIKNVPDSDLSKFEFQAIKDYSADGPSYLSLLKGDVIKHVKQMTDFWYQGILERKIKTGIFPEHFVKTEDVSSPKREFHVHMDYTSQKSDQLTIRQGDIIQNAYPVSNSMYKGTVMERSGNFPVDYAKIKYSRLTAAFLAEFEFLVISNYSSRKRGELTIKKGDGITNVNVLEKGWYTGTIIGRMGLFPAKCVKITCTRPSAPAEEESNDYKNPIDKILSGPVEQPGIPEELLCPICMELPEGHIYQCKNGHTVCRKCLKKMDICPQCRVTLKVEGGLIRNRVAESLIANVLV